MGHGIEFVDLSKLLQIRRTWIMNRAVVTISQFAFCPSCFSIFMENAIDVYVLFTSPALVENNSSLPEHASACATSAD